MSISPSAAGYTALIRWRGPDATVEIETRHRGFADAEAAALFANALAPAGAIGLRLRADHAIDLLLANDGVVRLTEAEVVLWRLPPEPTFSSRRESDSRELAFANDADFERRPWDEIQRIPSARGDYEQAQYGVLGPDGLPVDVLIDWDEEHHLQVRVNQDALPLETLPAFALGALPSR
ncbi:MAG: hypothetical protein ABSB49_10130 [Polyangia bacterium]|jgi:hypothetical protein